MAMFYPVDCSPIEPFTPLRFEPPSSLIQDYPPDKDVNALLLGCGDARNILFTIYEDENKGKPRLTDVMLIVVRFYA